MSALVLIGRGVALFWTVLILACNGNIIQTASNGNPGAINYVMFVAVLSIVSLLYQFFAYKFTNKDGRLYKLGNAVIDAINTFTFVIGGIVLAARLGAHSCNNNDYLERNSITNGADNMGARCRLAQATTAFLWFGFATWACLLVLSLMKR